MPDEHSIRVVVEHTGVIGGWLEYTVECNMLNPSDTFSMKRPWSLEAWEALRTDVRVKISIDGTIILDGFVDRRRRSTRDNTIEISGRDRAGRLYQESAMRMNYAGLTMVDAIKKLVDPWFTTVTLSDARNRALRTGKGRRVPAGNEPLVINTKVKASAGKVHPGQTRWQVIQEIVSQAGLIAWSSADGKEFFVGKPNYSQAAQFLIAHPRAGSSTRSTCKSLDIADDVGDSYSLIAVVGTSAGDDRNYGAGLTRSARALDFYSGDDASSVSIDRDGRRQFVADGTGGAFLHPKRLLMPEANFDANEDAWRVAELEMARRNIRQHPISAVMPNHGQFVNGSKQRTIYAPNTIARVLDEEMLFDVDALIIGGTFTGSRSGAEETALELVPAGTEIVP